MYIRPLNCILKHVYRRIIYVVSSYNEILEVEKKYLVPISVSLKKRRGLGETISFSYRRYTYALK